MVSPREGNIALIDVGCKDTKKCKSYKKYNPDDSKYYSAGINTSKNDKWSVNHYDKFNYVHNFNKNHKLGISKTKTQQRPKQSHRSKSRDVLKCQKANHFKQIKIFRHSKGPHLQFFRNS